MPAWVAALRPGEIPLWVTWSGSLALILALYAVKFLALRRSRGRLASLVLFLAATAAAVPLAYLLAADWGNEFLAPVAIYVGYPVATLAVPCASFAWDWARWDAGADPWDRVGRVLLELMIAVPVWLYLWVWFEFLVLQWVWI
jgi:hypothetical protein